jgi:Fe-S-cluster-containing dehydrogenase component/DMSO reductase anchor subunit
MQSCGTGLVVEESPLTSYLESQQKLETPVATFARGHDEGHITEPVYDKLIPLTAPAADEQYAFEVNLDQCTGCKACVAACHSLNGLDDEETWRDVGLIIGGTAAQPYQQTITTACHHCEDPGCLNGCPVLAYDKDPVTGIVRHLDDQCIGCEYCVLKCPYDVPKYSKSKGIVRKCDMCHGRLSAGEAPACVQACPTEAIRITTVKRSASAEAYSNPDFLEPFPDRDYTRPTTRYVSDKPIPANARSADEDVLRVQHAHWPLVWMLSLTQAGWGIMAVNRFTSSLWLADLVGAVFFFGGIGVSVSHLGRPLGAWRAFLGLRRSWLSREIIVFGGVMPLSALALVTPWIPFLQPYYDIITWKNFAVGALGVFCSAMIYHDTKRHLWRFSFSATEFYVTAALVGMALVGAVGEEALLLSTALLGVMIRMILDTLRIQLSDQASDRAERVRGALLKGALKSSARMQLFSQLAAGLCLTLALVAGGVPGIVVGVMGGLFIFAAEVLGRAHFFQTVDSPKMPGGLAR